MDIYTFRAIFLWTIYAISAGMLMFDLIYISRLIIKKIHHIATTTRDERIYEWLNSTPTPRFERDNRR